MAGDSDESEALCSRGWFCRGMTQVLILMSGCRANIAEACNVLRSNSVKHAHQALWPNTPG